MYSTRSGELIYWN